MGRTEIVGGSKNIKKLICEYSGVAISTQRSHKAWLIRDKQGFFHFLNLMKARTFKYVRYFSLYIKF